MANQKTVITIPVYINEGKREDWTFDTEEFKLTEQNINEQAMKISNAYSLWSTVAAWYRSAIQKLEIEEAPKEARFKSIAVDAGRKKGIKYDSERAKQDAIYLYQEVPTGPYVFAEEVLKYQNLKSEYLYYLDLVENAILKALSIEKDMIVSLGAQVRAGYSATTNVVTK